MIRHAGTTPKIHKIMKLSSNSINPPVDVYYRANTDEKFLIPPLNALSLLEAWVKVQPAVSSITLSLIHI